MLNKKLLLCVEPKNAWFESDDMFKENAILFDDYMLKSFSDDIILLLNSVSKTEWVKIDDNYVLDNINKLNFNYYFREL